MSDFTDFFAWVTNGRGLTLKHLTGEHDQSTHGHGANEKLNVLKDGEALPRYDRINGKKIISGGVIKLGNGQRVAYYTAQAYNNRVYSFDKNGEIWRTSKRQAYIDAGGDKSMLSPSEKSNEEEIYQ